MSKTQCRLASAASLALSAALLVLLATWLQRQHQGPPAFDQIALGMSMSEVENILGGPPTGTEPQNISTRVIHFWELTSHFVIVKFENGQVIEKKREDAPSLIGKVTHRIWLSFLIWIDPLLRPLR
jgi:hypothetical protein